MKHQNRPTAKLSSTLFLISIFFSSIVSIAQSTSTLVQVGQDIDGEYYSQSGRTISLNADGTIVAIGASRNDNFTGHVRIYQNIDNSWIQMGQDIDGMAEYYRLGISVSLNALGNIVAIGALGNGMVGIPTTGRTRVYEYNGSEWVQIGNDIFSTDESKKYEFGFNVSLNADGNVLAVAEDNYDHDHEGQVRVFQFENDEWVQIGNAINGYGWLEGFGTTLDINNEGNILAVGSRRSGLFGEVSRGGTAQVFKIIEDEWVKMGSTLYGDDRLDAFGVNLSLSADGAKLAVGAGQYQLDNNKGYVRVFEYTDDWIQIGETIYGESIGDEAGSSVSLSADGEVVAIGSWRKEWNGVDRGQARVFQFIDNEWIRIARTYGEEPRDRFGQELCVNAVGNTVAIGSIYHNSSRGHVRVFEYKRITSISSPQNAVFQENQLGTALDVNAYIGKGNDVGVNYSIVGGDDQNYFTIDTSSGEIFFLNSPDFENPVDTDGDNIYNLTIETYSSGVSIDVTQDVSISVVDINEEPVITSENQVTVIDNTSEVFTVMAEDEDANTVLSFELLEGEFDNYLFFIDAINGNLEFISTPDFNNPLDANMDNNYDVLVEVKDEQVAVSQHITITVLSYFSGDVNNNGTIDENEIAGDVDGDGLMAFGEVAGDVNGNGIIDDLEIMGDVDGNGEINDNEIAGDENGDGIISGDEIDQDVDRDGILKQTDLCANTPIGEAVNTEGCSSSQLDDDHDGIMNNIDLCDNTMPDINVDERGCPLATVMNIDKKEFPFILYPIPADEIVIIEVPRISQITDIVIMSLGGQIQTVDVDYPEKNITKLNLENLSAGVFLVSFKTKEGGMFTERIIKR